MSPRRSGPVLAAAGLILVIVALLADVIGVGRSEGFGLNQTVGAILGVIVLAVGLQLWKRRPTVSAGQSNSDEDEGQIARMQDEGGPA